MRHRFLSLFQEGEVIGFEILFRSPGPTSTTCPKLLFVWRMIRGAGLSSVGKGSQELA